MKDMNFSDYKKMKEQERTNANPLPPTYLELHGNDENKHHAPRNIQVHTVKSQGRNIPVRQVEQERYCQSDYNNGYYPQNSRPQYYQSSPQNQQYNGYIQNENILPEPPRKTPIKKRKKKHHFSRFLLSVLLIAAIISGTVFGYAYSLCSKTNYVKTDWRHPNFSAMSDSSVYNVLLVGTDKESDGASRSDTMMLLSIDTKNQKLKMTSFLRDMWVEIPGEESHAKLNAAFAHGGASLMMETIEENFKVRIDNYILVDFDMFKALIDGLGGVDVDITKKEASFINRTSHAKVTEGINHLDGDYALIYCRIRKLDSDFNRTQRQRKVMTAILRQVQENGIFKSASTASDVLPYITTDINAFKLTIKAFSALKYLSYESEQLQIPLDNAYQDKRINGQAVLSVDFDKNIEALQNFIYGE
ncbi:MAG: LCP family protein [Clostridia bacterium]|nr:LCP family protein [Clostridia bacterium]